MKIYRNVDSKNCEFELSDKELYNAYKEQENIFDMEDIKDVFACLDDSELWETYGLSRGQLELLIDEMAYQMRRNINKYDMSWDYARDDAIQNVADAERKRIQAIK